jgi:uncharacterized membrane protein HdeD (DUF308 family)
MYKERLKLTNVVVNLGIALVVIGLVLQTFADTAGLYCFAIGVVLILIYIILKIGEFTQKEKQEE